MDSRRQAHGSIRSQIIGSNVAAFLFLNQVEQK